MDFTFDRAKHVFTYPGFDELIKDTIRFFNGTPVQPVPPVEKFEGAGVYALYYIGKMQLYKPLYLMNRLEYKQPVYVGKAVPSGWRQSRISDSSTFELYKRLTDHAKSLSAANNLEVSDFLCRFMIMEGGAQSIIGAVEAALIRYYKPLWNCLIDGFGNHDPGKGRYEQARSGWDLIHPGRRWAERCAPPVVAIDDLKKQVKAFFAACHND